MSCTICQTKYSFFTKEVACPGCGFSYCNKCLKYKCNVPNIGVKKVCGRCYNKHKSSTDATTPQTPDSERHSDEPLTMIDITKKLDSLENPAKPPIVMYTHTNHWDKFKKGLEPVDQEIVDRLRKLKGEDRNIELPSVDEIKRRLAILKDESPDAADTGSNMIHEVDNRTDQQKADDLIQQYFEQLELSSASNSCSEIQMRLRALRDEDDKPNSCYAKERNNEIDDEEETITKKLIEKALAEAALEARFKDNDEDDDENELENMDTDAEHCTEDEDEKLMCVMCDQTSDLMRCMGCTGDLYCPICFEDNHDDFEMGKHKTQPVKSIKKN
ncbi:hypothetical protein KM043_011394 [Ampulex compressa]|nr:hypothetical protein KM043_011394 [Ampulex compressa]